MQSSLLGSLVLLSCLIASEAPPTKYYIHFTFGLTWDEAQHFCKSYYTDLATISTASDMDSMDLKQYLVWVGLHREWWSWKWSDGAYYHVSDWGKNEPHQEYCASVYFSNKKIYSRDCGTRLMFVCRDGEEYTFVNETKTWPEALDYCKSQNGNLASFSSSDMNQIFTEFDFPIWIGLRRGGGNSFSWSSGDSGVTSWKHGEPSSDANCVALSSLSRLMATEPCDVRLPFVCMWDGNVNVLLVTEEKSWEEALEHCRGLSRDGLRFDLVSVQPGDEHQYMMGKIMAADTEEVWTGLRFLGDEWVWVNGAAMTSDLPQCPMLEQHCGALSKNDTGSVEPRDCSERKSFLCYSFAA
ncbi:C-type mannose receptor 2-like [Poecilia formosa]|nr:PREDICTED: C-type mannose receptor 2-like [Poecilia formosa]XP_016530193.1 PREDICTED: C-type mannose receptor 2-like [Poecilia formosa]